MCLKSSKNWRRLVRGEEVAIVTPGTRTEALFLAAGFAPEAEAAPVEVADAEAAPAPKRRGRPRRVAEPVEEVAE